ncbi:MAG: VWA domain-containing protein [Myxococcota bacterium]
MSIRHPRTIGRRVAVLAILAAATAVVAEARKPAGTIQTGAQATSALPRAAERPRIDVVFVLDTTGSMSGLIEGAKERIWSLTSSMADGQPSPRIRVGLLGYRDRGDDYVTRSYDLTDDIDAVYQHLSAFRTGGGGDGPESVNQALHEAVARMSWDPGQEVYKVLFLVGDAPPHMDYQDDVPYEKTAEIARSRGIAINTIQCGSMAGTAVVWRDIARRGSGEFAAIEQNGGMVALATPMDAPLAELSRELVDTVVAYGDRTSVSEIERKIIAAKAASPAVAASRLGYLSKQGGRANSGRRDLIDAVKDGLVSADEIDDADLPAAMRGFDAREKKAYVQRKLEARAQIQARIDELSRQRDAHLRAGRKRRAEAGEAGGFDSRVMETIEKQAAGYGIHYE